MKTRKNNQLLRPDLSWVRRQRLSYLSYDLLFALCMAGTFIVMTLALS